MLFAQRGPTMVLRDHRWPTLCEAGAKVGELTAAPLIWSRPREVVQNVDVRVVFIGFCNSER